MKTLADTFSWSLRGEAAAFNAVCTDTRELSDGALFVALEGENHDAHAFVGNALEQGAAGAVVHKLVPGAEPVLMVDDTQKALGQIAALHRDSWHGELFAVTGSAGKTSTKEMLATILSGSGTTLATRGNFNNEIGVPLTLLRLQNEQRYAVVEMGAAKPGDIAYLVSLARPKTSILTNAMAAHLEGFGDLATVARTKGEIFLGEPDCVSVINLDDSHSQLWLQMAKGSRIVTYSAAGNNTANVRASAIEAGPAGSQFTLCTPVGDCRMVLNVPGAHNIANALAAASAALSRGIGLDIISGRLKEFTGVAGRMQFLSGKDGLLIIDDSYNANPSAVRSALDVLAQQDGKRVFILGNMAELGTMSADLHRQVGTYARDCGVDKLLAVGSDAAMAAQGYGEGSESFSDMNALTGWIRKEDYLASYDACLVKGSRSAGMERAVAQLLAWGGRS